MRVPFPVEDDERSPFVQHTSRGGARIDVGDVAAGLDSLSGPSRSERPGPMRQGQEISAVGQGDRVVDASPRHDRGMTEQTITPDDKDWTWVLTRPCAECGLDLREVPAAEVAGRLRDNAAAWPAELSRAGAEARIDPARWSTLEYGCHVRDVFRRFDGRLVQLLSEPDPVFANWDQDATAVAERYGEQDPTVVADELLAAGEQLAARFDGVTGEQWRRPGRRSDGAVFTVDSLARYGLHDPVHHLWDVRGGIASTP